jgi:hypothetical protein|tara:strand:+ start:522 stop:863 length:342 start_codon:yes stop_codon:yes gene_type:complete
MTAEQKPLRQVGTLKTYLYTIINRAVTGAAVIQVNMPCRKGEIADVLLRYDKLWDLENTLAYFSVIKSCKPLELWTKFSAIKAKIVHNTSIFDKAIQSGLGARVTYHFTRKEY